MTRVLLTLSALLTVLGPHLAVDLRPGDDSLAVRLFLAGITIFVVTFVTAVAVGIRRSERDEGDLSGA